MRNVTKFDRENGAKFGPKCCEINEIYICYEFSEQYQLGNDFLLEMLQNSNLSPKKRDASIQLGCLRRSIGTTWCTSSWRRSGASTFCREAGRSESFCVDRDHVVHLFWRRSVRRLGPRVALSDVDGDLLKFVKLQPLVGMLRQSIGTTLCTP